MVNDGQLYFQNNCTNYYCNLITCCCCRLQLVSALWFPSIHNVVSLFQWHLQLCDLLCTMRLLTRPTMLVSCHMPELLLPAFCPQSWLVILLLPKPIANSLAKLLLPFLCTSMSSCCSSRPIFGCTSPTIAEKKLNLCHMHIARLLCLVLMLLIYLLHQHWLLVIHGHVAPRSCTSTTSSAPTIQRR